MYKIGKAIGSILGGFLRSATGDVLEKPNDEIDGDEFLTWALDANLSSESKKRQKIAAKKAILLTKCEARTRVKAALILAKHKDEKVLQILLKATNDKESCVKWNVASALGKMDDLSVVTPLIKMLTDNHKLVREDALKSLVNITGINIGANADEWEKWWESNKDMEFKKRENKNQSLVEPIKSTKKKKKKTMVVNGVVIEWDSKK